MSQMHFPDPKRLFLKSSANENTFKNMKEQSGDRLEYIQELYFSINFYIKPRILIQPTHHISVSPAEMTNYCVPNDNLNRGSLCGSA